MKEIGIDARSLRVARQPDAQLDPRPPQGADAAPRARVPDADRRLTPGALTVPTLVPMTGQSVRAAVGLGSNLGDRTAMLALATRELGATPGIEDLRVSEAVETPALTIPGSPAQPDYLNAAAAFATTLPARALLARLLEIERAAGRDRSVEPRWGARVLDLDLLLFGDAVIEEDGLSVPHPRMHEREFVLRPLAGVWPEAMHPLLGVTARELLGRLGVGTMDP